MPLWDTPPRRLLEAIKRMRADSRHADENAPTNDIEMMPVVQINADSTYLVPGSGPVGATGSQPNVRVGDFVPVIKVNGRPQAIIAHSARRAKWDDPDVELDRGLIEQLIVGTQNGGPRDIFFRNDSVLKSLNVRALTNVDYADVFWGAKDNMFAARRTGAAPIFDVFQIQRTKGTVTAQGSTPQVKLVRTYTLRSAAEAVALGTFGTRGTLINLTSIMTGGTFSGPLGGGASNFWTFNESSAYLNDVGDFIMVWFLSITLIGIATAPFPPPSSVNITPITFRYNFVVNHTTKTVLLNTLTGADPIQDAFGVVPPHINTFDPDNVPVSDSGSNSSVVSLYFFGGGGISGLRMTGDKIDSFFTQALYQKGHFFGSFTGDVQKKTAVAFLHPSGRFPATVVFPLTLNSLSSGFGFSVYRAAPSESSRDTLLSERHAIVSAQGGDSTPFQFGVQPVLVSFDTGAMKAIDTSRLHLDDLNLILIPSDTLYTLGLDQKDSDRFFVTGWQKKDGKPSTLTLDTTKKLVENATLATHKKLVGVLNDAAHTITKGVSPNEVIVLFDSPGGLLPTSFHVVPFGVAKSSL